MSLYQLRLHSVAPEQHLTWVEAFIHDHDGCGFVTRTSSLSASYNHLLNATIRLAENSIGWPIVLRERTGLQKRMDLFFEVKAIKGLDGPALQEYNRPKHERFPESSGWVAFNMKIKPGVHLSPSQALDQVVNSPVAISLYEIGHFEHHATTINMIVRPWGSPPRDLVNAND